MEHLRIVAIAAAVLGVGCSSVSENTRAERTGAMWPERESEQTGAMWSQRDEHRGVEWTWAEREKEAQEAMNAEPRTVSMTPEDALAASEGTGSQAGSTGGSPGSGTSGGTQEPGSPGAAGSSEPGGSGMGQPGMGQPGMGQPDTGSSPSGMGQAGGSAGSEAGASGGTMGGPMKGMKAGKAQRLSGKLSQISSDSVTITPKKGEAKTLKVTPDTKITMNGKAAQPTDLKEGQQVRASWSSKDGEDTATQISAGKAGTSARKGKGASGGTGSSGGSMK